MTGHSSRARWVINGCSSGKRAYESRNDAKKVAGQKRRRGQARMSVYLCAECGKFHIGHLPLPVLRGDVPRKEIIQPGTNNPTRKKKP